MTDTADPPTAALAKPGPVNPLTLLQTAVERGIDPDQLSKLIDLQERWEVNQAAAEFARALAAFQAEMPPVAKDRAVLNKDRATARYKFAGFEDIMLVAGPLLSKHGIAVTFSQTAAAGELTMTMRLRVGKHYEDKTFTAIMPDVPAIAQSMGMNEPQALGLVSSYFKRYCLVNGLNIVVASEDNDAAFKIGAAEVSEVWNLIRQYERQVGQEFKLEAYLAWLDAPAVEGIARRNFEKAVRFIKDKLRAVPAKAEGGAK